MGADREVETALAVSILSTLQDYGVESFVQHVEAQQSSTLSTPARVCADIQPE